MSLRKQGRILGIAHSYLSMLVNGKKKWPDDLRYRYSVLVISVVNTTGGRSEMRDERNLNAVAEKRDGGVAGTRTLYLFNVMKAV